MMKAWTSLPWWLLLLPTVSSQQPPTSPDTTSTFPPAAQPVRVEPLPSDIRQDTKRVRLYFGPYTIFGQSEPRGNATRGMDPNGVRVKEFISGFCEDCTVLSAKTDMHYLNGTRATIATGMYNHHVLILDATKRDTLPWFICNENDAAIEEDDGPAGFMIAGVDEAPNLYYLREPAKDVSGSSLQSGYYIPRASYGPRQFVLDAEFVNYNPTAQEVYVTAETEYVEGRPGGWHDASMSLLNINGCGPIDYHLPTDKGRIVKTSPSYTLPKDGYIINGKGHLHNGGVSISLLINGTSVCDSVARYGGDDTAGIGPDGKPWTTIQEMSQCPGAVKVARGDVLSLRSVYDLDLHPQRQAADGHGHGEQMGTFFVLFVAA